jgi:Cu+-exporting ATPase
MLDLHQIKPLDQFYEEAGKGISAVREEEYIKIGSAAFVGEHTDFNSPVPLENGPKRTAVHISTQNGYRGCYVFCNSYREGMKEVFDALSANVEILILSGDNEGEMPFLKSMLPEGADLKFNQSPQDKLDHIKKLQEEGKKVLMIGDGLNDSGALAQSNVGVVISDNTNAFSPASDGILDASRFGDLATFLKLSKQGIGVIKWAFLFSLFYNVIGLGFAVTGNLAPVVAAILMPLSSISIVIFTTVATHFLGKKLRTKQVSES